MSEQNTPAHPFFQPRPEHDTLQTAYLLWKIAQSVTVMPNGCWLWTGATNPSGYGHFNIGGRVENRTKMIHRFVYQLCVGDTSNKMFVCHNCPGGDNRTCCNPAHLWLGHHSQNMADAVAKGRARGLKGEANKAAKLTAAQAREIRARADEGIMPLAKAFGVSRETIRCILRGERYQ